MGDDTEMLQTCLTCHSEFCRTLPQGAFAVLTMGLNMIPITMSYGYPIEEASAVGILSWAGTWCFCSVSINFILKIVSCSSLLCTWICWMAIDGHWSFDRSSPLFCYPALQDLGLPLRLLIFILGAFCFTQSLPLREQ